MMLKRFRLFVEEISSQQELNQRCASLDAYRRFERRWYVESGKELEDTDLINKLNQTLAKNEHWKERGSHKAFFPISDLEAVIVGGFRGSPQKNTRTYVISRLNKCITDSDNAFKASHDTMTGLLSKEAFTVSLQTTLAEALQVSTEAASSTSSDKTRPSYALFALDLDYFKQVNDNYGHLFGDVVLKCFALRLEKSARELEKSNEMLHFQLARTGGEEFMISLKGQMETGKPLELGELFCRQISHDPIPSDDEWKYFSNIDSYLNIDLPLLSERRQTVSIGVAALSDIDSAQNPERVATDLMHYADVALYRAKAAGRNTVRCFSEILLRCGRVLEHHADADVLARIIHETA